jgi:hypothetical protein
MPRRRKATKDTGDDPEEQRNAIEINDDDNEDEGISSDEDFDDDPTVRTYDIFMSDQLKEHIYLLQYPIRNPEDPYCNDYLPSEARIKPNEGLLEVDVPIVKQDFSFLHGQKSAGTQSDGVRQEARDMDQQRLSGKTQTNQANYFLATMRGSSPCVTSANIKGKCTFLQ